jgi:hydrogenase nickel incorporation protein HypA/HybF
VRLNLVIGHLSGVNVESIRFAFDLLSPDTWLSGAELSIEEPRAACRCEDCKAETEIEELVSACPICGSQHLTIIGGQELTLESIELEEI